MTSIPFVVYSDGPSQPSGLARIARDLTQRLHAEQETLGIQVSQVGWNPRPHAQLPWPSWGLSQLHSEGDWGAGEIGDLWPEIVDEGDGDQGVLFTIWDPSRSFSLLNLQHPQRELWGYFPIDGANIGGSIGGPAREAVLRYNRALAYGRWGSQILATIRKPLPWLPHGIDLQTWTTGHHQDTVARAAHAIGLREGSWVLGCVATNQIRKDLGLYFATLAELRRRGEKVRGWLHTDTPTRAWSVAQLAEDFGLGRYVSVTLSLDDPVLSAAYSLCGATFGPGLGEGFGYPLVESLACGTPVVHTDYAGGRELVPVNAWRVPAVAWRLEGLYGLQRPVMTAEDCANAVMRAVDWKRHDHQVCQEYCRGAVSHLGWEQVWPRWRSWFKQGLEAYRG